MDASDIPDVTTSGMTLAASRLWDERFCRGVSKGAVAWAGLDGSLEVEHPMRVVLGRDNLERAVRLFPGETLAGLSHTAEVQGQSVLFFLTSLGLDPDLLWVDAHSHPVALFLSGLPEAAHEVYVRLRCDGLTVPDAHAGALLLTLP